MIFLRQLSLREPPRRKALTPLGDELMRGPTAPGKPSLLERIRWRRHGPAPTTWYGVFLFGSRRLALLVAVVLVALIAVIYFAEHAHEHGGPGIPGLGVLAPPLSSR